MWVGCLFGYYCILLKNQKSIKKQIFLNINMGKGMALELVEQQHKGWNVKSEGTYLINNQCAGMLCVTARAGALERARSTRCSRGQQQ